MLIPSLILIVIVCYRNGKGMFGMEKIVITDKNENFYPLIFIINSLIMIPCETIEL